MRIRYKVEFEKAKEEIQQLKNIRDKYKDQYDSLMELLNIIIIFDSNISNLFRKAMIYNLDKGLAKML